MKPKINDGGKNLVSCFSWFVLLLKAIREVYDTRVRVDGGDRYPTILLVVKSSWLMADIVAPIYLPITPQSL